jgi:hypothetical protein
VDSRRAYGNYYDSDVSVDSSDVEDRLEDNVEYSDTLLYTFSVETDAEEWKTGDIIGSQLSGVS